MTLSYTSQESGFVECVRADFCCVQIASYVGSGAINFPALILAEELSQQIPTIKSTSGVVDVKRCPSCGAKIRMVIVSRSQLCETLT